MIKKWQYTNKFFLNKCTTSHGFCWVSQLWESFRWRGPWNDARGMCREAGMTPPPHPYLWWLRRQWICLQCRKPRFDPWVGKISWRREWLPTPVFLSGEFLGWRSLVDYSPWGRQESDTTEWLTNATLAPSLPPTTPKTVPSHSPALKGSQF